MPRNALATPELRAYDPPWYDKAAYAVTDWLYGPNANAQQTGYVKNALGPDNPFNLPAQATRGVNTMSEGYRQGDYGKMAGGAVETAASAIPMGYGFGRMSNAIYDRMPANALGSGGGKMVTPQPGIRAYHGSPHDFDRFDMSKIGTGEGAQAYGHGLYFAEKEGVARQYRDKLADPSGKKIAYDGRNVGASSDPIERAQYVFAANSGNAAAAKEALARSADQYPHMRDTFEAAAKHVDALDPAKVAQAGRMYEVNIKADPNDFLDWDKPLSQQSEKVRGAVDGVLAARTGKQVTPEFYGAFGQSGAGINNLVSAWTKHDAGGTSRALREAGIPGIRYLDQGSRGAGEGSRNYVVFDDALVEILRKYGLLPAAAGGSALGYGAGQPEQPTNALGY